MVCINCFNIFLKETQSTDKTDEPLGKTVATKTRYQDRENEKSNAEGKSLTASSC